MKFSRAAPSNVTTHFRELNQLLPEPRLTTWWTQVSQRMGTGRLYLRYLEEDRTDSSQSSVSLNSTTGGFQANGAHIIIKEFAQCGFQHGIGAKVIFFKGNIIKSLTQ